MQLITNTAQGAIDLHDQEICKRVADVLIKHYEGHPWYVEADSRPHVGMIIIKCHYPDELGRLPKFGARMRIDGFSEEKVIRYGGEILERYNLARARCSEYAHMDAIANGLDTTGAR